MRFLKTPNVVCDTTCLIFFGALVRCFHLESEVDLVGDSWTRQTGSTTSNTRWTLTLPERLNYVWYVSIGDNLTRR